MHIADPHDVARGPHARLSTWAPFPIAALVALCALAGIYAPAIYARETASWTAQGVGQDWVSLLVVVPVLVGAGGAAWRGSRRARLMLGGALLYTAYSYAIYAFAVHFNPLFLAYCATLGLSTFALLDLVEVLRADEPGRWYTPGAPLRVTAGALFALAGVFGALWLRQDLPATVQNTPPADLAATGLLSNPVHVLDLSLLLPLLIIVGVALRRRAWPGLVLAPIALAFAVMMALAIGGIIVMMYVRGIATDLTPAVAMAVVAAGCVAVLVRLLGALRVPLDGSARSSAAKAGRDG